MDIGLLVLRIALGGALVLQSHGKLVRPGRAGAVAFFHDMGFVPAARMVTLAGLTELAAGTALLVGLGTVPATSAALGVLVAATAVNARNGYANSNGGAEYPLVATLVAAAVAFTGAGGISIDALLGWDDPAVGLGVLTIVVGVASAVPLLGGRRRELAARRVDGAIAFDKAAA